MHQKYELPYIAVIFTSTLHQDSAKYHMVADRMVQLAEKQEGFLGYESARDRLGITVSYWKDMGAVKLWKEQGEHLIAQEMGRQEFYDSFTVRIAEVKRQYSWDRS